MLPRSANVSMLYNGANATEQIDGYLNSFEYKDVASGTTDSISVVINDQDHKWIGPWFPVKGDKLIPTILLKNWTAEGQIIPFPCGTFGVDDFSFSGGPIKMNLEALALPSATSFKAEERTETYERATLQEIRQIIANRAGISLFFGWTWNTKETGTYTSVRYQYTSSDENKTFTVKAGTEERLLTCNEPTDNLTETTAIALVADKVYLQTGKLSSIDYPNGKASVTYEDLNDSTTAAFSFLAWQYWMPKEGDQVLVAHLSNGTCAAVILGPVWHDGHRPPEGQKELYRKDYNRKYWDAYQRYDHKALEYLEVITGTYDIRPTKDFTLTVNGTTIITVRADGSIEITDPAGIKITTPQIEVTGDVIADGKKVSLAHHTHPGCGGGSTGEPN